MEITRQKNVASRVLVPMINSSSRPDYLASAVDTPAFIAQSWQDGQTASTLAVTSVTITHKVGGLHEVVLPQAFLNPDTGSDDYIALKISGTNVDEQTVLIKLTAFDDKIEIHSDLRKLAGVVQSLTDLKDFADAGYDPATNKVEGVKLVDTSTANTDMRGTDSAALASELATHDGKLDTVDTVVDAIKAKTDNLPADPASETNVSSRATPAQVATELATYDGPTHAEMTAEHNVLESEHIGINTNINANETKIDSMQTDVTAIDAKTTNLPSDPASETNVDATETKVDTVISNQASLATQSSVDAIQADTSLSIYQGGIWFNASASNINTVVGTDGIPGNPVSSWAAVATLLASVGVNKIYIIGATSALDRDMINIEYVGVTKDSKVLLHASGTYSVDNSVFTKCIVSNDVKSGDSIDIIDGTVIDLKLDIATIKNSHIITGNSVYSGAVVGFNNCFGDNNSNASIDVNSPAASTILDFSNCYFHRQLNIDGGNANLFVGLSGEGQVNFGFGTAGGLARISGHWSIVNTLGITISENDNNFLSSVVADDVWDEGISGHTAGGSFGAKNQKVVPSETINDYKADVSGLATEANATTNKNSIITEVDANETKIDAVKVDTAAIKSKTDNLPADPASDTNVDANETKIDAVKVDTAAIKLQTDKLGFDGSDYIEARVKATDNINLSTLQKADVNSEVDQSLLDYDSSGGVAKESSVITIQNNATFVSTPPTPVLIPSAGDSIFKITARLFDTTGNPEDPDVQDGAAQIAIIGRAVNGAANKTAFFDDEAGSTPATASTAYSPSMKMNRIGVGMFETYYKLPSTENPDNWVWTYNYAESAVERAPERTTTMASTAISTTTLADSAANKDIIAEALKERDVSSTGAVSGSIHKDIMDNVDANETKIDSMQTDVTAIDAKTTNLPSDPASETNVDATETKVDAVKAKTDNLPTDPASETNATSNALGINTNIDANETKIDSLATGQAALSVEHSVINTNVDANETKIDAVKVDTAAIKAKTDNLPADPASETSLSSTHGSGSWETSGGDATEAKQDTIIANQAAINVNIDSNETKIDAVKVDTAAVKVQTDKMNFTGSDIHSIPKAKDATVGLSTQEKADVLVEARKPLQTDTITEIVDMTDVPKNPTIEQATMLHYMDRRNGSHGEDDLTQILNDAGTAILDEDIASTATEINSTQLHDA